MADTPLSTLVFLLVISAACSSDPLGCTNGCDTESDPLQPPQQRVTALAAGFSSSCALTQVEMLYCWGENRFGELGDGTRTPRLAPIRVTTMLRFVSVAGTHGTSRICATTRASLAYCWGYNINGELGDGTQEDQYLPSPVYGGIEFRSLSTSYHTCGVATSGRAFCWGPDGSGELGRGTVGGGSVLPAPVVGDLRFTSIGNGLQFSCGLTIMARAYCWGRGDMLGDGSEQSRAVPSPVGGNHLFIELSIGEEHACGVKQDGSLYCWGKADVWYNPPVLQPRRVIDVPPFTRIAAGDYHTCALTRDGAPWCWPSGQTPRPLATSIRFAGLASGQNYTCGYTPGGAAYCWSIQFSFPFLGDGTSRSDTLPVRVAPFPT